MEDLNKFSIEELNAILAKEEETHNDLLQKKTVLEGEIQQTNREKEREEERMMNAFSKRIQSLKRENAEMLVKIQQEEEYIKNNLQQKLDDVLKEKESLEMTLSYQESQVIEQLQQDIDRMTQEATILESQVNSGASNTDSANNSPNKNNTIALTRSKSMESLKKIAEDSEKTKKEYEIELANLRKDIERLITANSILMQRVGNAQMSLVMQRPPGSPNITSSNSQGADQNHPSGTPFPSLFDSPLGGVETRRFSDFSDAAIRFPMNVQRQHRQSKPG